MINDYICIRRTGYSDQYTTQEFEGRGYHFDSIVRCVRYYTKRDRDPKPMVLLATKDFRHSVRLTTGVGLKQKIKRFMLYVGENGAFCLDFC